MTMKRWISSLLAAALCLSLLIAPAGAYTRVDTTKPVSLTLRYQYNEAGVEGLELSLYKVYDMSDAVRFTVTDGFQAAYGSEVNFNLSNWTSLNETTGKNEVNWTGLATTLESLLQRDSEAPKVAPLMTRTTAADGLVKFESTAATAEAPAVKLTAGLYLVMGATLVDGYYTYTPQTFLVSLPHLAATDSWEYEYVYYDLTANGKLQVQYNPPGGGDLTTSITAVKRWDDDGENRPASVEVQLLHNGSLYDMATLNDGNGWRKTWTGLSTGGTWSVAEADVPDGYSVDISRTGSEFVITNTAETELDDEDTPLGPGEEDPGDLPDVDLGDEDVPLGDGDVDLGDEDVPAGSLPNTGTLWWPVQLLTAAGIVLFSIGWLDLRRNKKRENEK